MSSGYYYNNSSGFNGYQYYQQQKNLTQQVSKQPFVAAFDYDTVIEQAHPNSGASTSLLWIGDSNYHLSSYDLLDDDSLRLYTRHSVKPYWRLKQTTNGSNNNKKDLAAYANSIDQKLPLINGFIPFDLVENNVDNDTSSLKNPNVSSVINDIISLNVGIVTLTDNCNVNLSDRKGSIINTMNPITHPYLMYSPNIINNNVGKCRLNCISKVNNMPNVVVVGGYNMNQLVYIDVINNKIINRMEYTALKNVTMIKRSGSLTPIMDNLLFVLYDSKYIDFVDTVTNTIVYTFSLQVTTNCQNDTIVNFDVFNGNLIILTNNAFINFQYHSFKLLNEIIIVSSNEFNKPNQFSIHNSMPHLLAVSNQKLGKIGFVNLMEFKSLVCFLSIDKLYNLQNNSSNGGFDFVSITPLGDKLFTIKNILEEKKIIKTFSVPGYKQAFMSLFNYNINKVILERADDNELDSVTVVDDCLNRSVFDYSVNVDHISGLNVLDPFGTNYNANEPLQMNEFLSQSTNISKDDKKMALKNATSSIEYKNAMLENEFENITDTDDYYKNYKYDMFSLENITDPVLALVSQVVKDTAPKKHNRSIPSELLLPLINEENSTSENQELPLDINDNGPPLIYRKLDIPIANSNESSGNNLLIINNKDLFSSKLYSKYNNTNYCGLYPLLQDESDIMKSNIKINMNSIMQFITYNPRLYSMIKKFMSEVPWQGKPLLIHEFGYFIDNLNGNKIYDNRILLNFIEQILPKQNCNTILQVYQFIDTVITKEYQQYYKKAFSTSSTSTLSSSTSNKKKHITGYITNAASGKKKTANGNVTTQSSSIGKHQKNITNHLDVLLSKEFQYAKANHNNITTESLTILAYMTDKEFTEVLLKNNNSSNSWLLPEFEVAISKISPQLFFKVDESEVIPKYCSSPEKYYLTSVVFNVDGPQKNQVTCIKFEDGWFLFNDHLVYKISEKEVLNLTNKLPMLFTYTVQPFTSIESISSDLNLDMIKQDAFQFFDYEIVPGSNAAMDSEYVIENYKRQEITPDGSVKIIKQEVKVLARLTAIQRVINKDNEEDIRIIFDDYVSHDKPIEDYLTKFSGILPNDLSTQSSTKKLHERQETYRKFWILVKLNCKIIGHGLKSDFEGIVISIPKEQIVDTAVIYWMGGRLLSLKFLYYSMFSKIIQGDNHDSYEDSYAAMVLYEKYLEMVKDGDVDWQNFLDKLFDEGRKCGFKVGNI